MCAYYVFSKIPFDSVKQGKIKRRELAVTCSGLYNFEDIGYLGITKWRTRRTVVGGVEG